MLWVLISWGGHCVRVIIAAVYWSSLLATHHLIITGWGDGSIAYRGGHLHLQMLCLTGGGLREGYCHIVLALVAVARGSSCHPPSIINAKNSVPLAVMDGLQYVDCNMLIWQHALNMWTQKKLTLKDTTTNTQGSHWQSPLTILLHLGGTLQPKTVLLEECFSGESANYFKCALCVLISLQCFWHFSVCYQ